MKCYHHNILCDNVVSFQLLYPQYQKLPQLYAQDILTNFDSIHCG